MAKLKNVKFRVGRMYRIQTPNIALGFDGEVCKVDTLAIYLRSEKQGRILKFFAIHSFAEEFFNLRIVNTEIEYEKSFLGSKNFRVRNATKAEIILYGKKD